MKLRCPECSSDITLADVNVAQDIALCRRCAKNFSYAELSQSPIDEADIDHPLKGTWFQGASRGFEVGARVRSGVAFFLLPFSLAWTGGIFWFMYGKPRFLAARFRLESQTRPSGLHPGQTSPNAPRTALGGVPSNCETFSSRENVRARGDVMIYQSYQPGLVRR